ncbi:hypothetical protein Taro_049917 [Colocasia esculenta]|uniref:UBN2 domain-containing protein n=1 Tax=Colocasia esculenta TaxID=4460 RepID=A0A843XC27_COLES|nr:hypothetical protein [Colocasia esculenta]
MMQCAVHPKEYLRVSTCNSAKEMWDKLELIYEGTSEMRETKASMLTSKYEMFKMKHDETISDMFAIFMLIINGLKGLKKEYSESDLVEKILRSLPSSCNTKATIIEDSKDLSKMKLDELIGSLMTYELNVKRKEIEENPKKSIALKASNKNSSSSKRDAQQADDEDDAGEESRSDPIDAPGAEADDAADEQAPDEPSSRFHHCSNGGNAAPYDHWFRPSKCSIG